MLLTDIRDAWLGEETTHGKKFRRLTGRNPSIPDIIFATLRSGKKRSRPNSLCRTFAILWVKNNIDDTKAVEPLLIHAVHPSHGGTMGPYSLSGWDREYIAVHDHARTMDRVIHYCHPALQAPDDRTVDILLKSPGFRAYCAQMGLIRNLDDEPEWWLREHDHHQGCKTYNSGARPNRLSTEAFLAHPANQPDEPRGTPSERTAKFEWPIYPSGWGDQRGYRGLGYQMPANAISQVVWGIR
jgi:hypothetical protein